MSTSRPAIPTAIKRAVRRRCGFGCVICGLPLYEYEHMEGWALVRRHVAEEITLLCDRHHAERTKGLLPLEAVREADRQPFNRRRGVAPRYALHYSGRTAAAVMGNNHFGVGTLNGELVLAPVVIDGQPLVLFRLEDGHLLLSLSAYNAYGEPILIIEDNELRFGVEHRWDYELRGRTLVVRMTPGPILLEAEFAVPNTVIIRRGQFFRNGVVLDVSPDGVMIVNNGCYYSACGFSGMTAGVVIGPVPPGLSPFVQYVDVPRFPPPPPRCSECGKAHAVMYATRVDDGPDGPISTRCEFCEACASANGFDLAAMPVGEPLPADYPPQQRL